MRRILIFAALLLPCAVHAQTSAEERIKALEERLDKLENAPARTSLSAFNPAIGMALDTVLRSDDAKARFQFRSAEVNLEAPIDPFAKAWIVVNGSDTGVEVEEGTIETTALPGNLTVRGGRLFANFGRFAHFHDHELPSVDRPNSLDTFVGGESRADGAEVEHLFKLPFYLRGTLGAYTRFGAENDRTNATDARSLDQFTYLGRLATYADVGDDHSLELGVSAAWTPRRRVDRTAATTPGTEVQLKNTWRALGGVDLTYRFQPAQGGLYKGAVWGTEVFVNNETRFDPNTLRENDRVKSFAGYSYLELRPGRNVRVGPLVDFTQGLDNARTLTKSYSGFVTWNPTEFQRLRLQYTRFASNVPSRLNSDRIALQWTAVLGHHVHGFRDR